jgi:two-component sensor histidine kinase
MKTHTPAAPAAASGLALALIQSSNVPLLLLNGDCKVLAASSSFCSTFQLDPALVAGSPLARLGRGEWAKPQLDALLRATASGHVQSAPYEMDLDRAAAERHRLVVNAQKLDYGDADNILLLLTVADITRARLADELKDERLREKGIMLLELQHRVANSLQIIASVLLQSARRVQSDETRLHLHDAHHRVMSVAAIQQQLAASSSRNVELQPYFTDLCRSIGASMIRDHDQLSLNVTADASIAGPDTSVSLGLIVTELVINALKHAFPQQRHGQIMVDYHANGEGWLLSISDNGVGMPAADAHVGLGSTIVEALAKKLGAEVTISDAAPGTRVSILRGA